MNSPDSSALNVLVENLDPEKTEPQLHPLVTGGHSSPKLLVKVSEKEDGEPLVHVILSGVSNDAEAPEAIAEMCQLLIDTVQHPDFLTRWTAEVAARDAVLRVPEEWLSEDDLTEDDKAALAQQDSEHGVHGEPGTEPSA